MVKSDSTKLSPSRVLKVPNFQGSLPPRPLYIYLPRGYNERIEQRYPVLYMHDGQNVFEAFVQDSYVGSWRADEIADRLIAAGQMRECIIVGVSNGQAARLAEYLPPYAVYPPAWPNGARKGRLKASISPTTQGAADKTVHYYQEVAAYIGQHYRVLNGREHTATCGSSLGGLLSFYMAWEHPQFARNHAVMSPSFWITAQNGTGHYAAIERLHTSPPPAVRLWLDSGTISDSGDDGLALTKLANQALLANGFHDGPNYQFYIDQGGRHHESSWSARLDQVFKFLFPKA
ncbi:MAG: alpha/beta hydrolase-fold protein [Caldilineaceae bacterium]